MNRRQFFSQSLKLSALAIFAPTVVKAILGTDLAQAQEKRRAAPAAGGAAAGGVPMVDPKDSTAKAVKYVEDAAKAPDAKGNKCSTCNFYAKSGTNNGKEIGTCSIFAGKHVYHNAYCGSWSKKT